MENHHATVFMGKSTISMAIFNSFLYVYQRVTTFQMENVTALDQSGFREQHFFASAKAFGSVSRDQGMAVPYKGCVGVYIHIYIHSIIIIITIIINYYYLLLLLLLLSLLYRLLNIILCIYIYISWLHIYIYMTKYIANIMGYIMGIEIYV